MPTCDLVLLAPTGFRLLRRGTEEPEQGTLLLPRRYIARRKQVVRYSEVSPGVTYGYDSRGNRTSITDALSHETTFAYDSMSRLTTITYPDSTTTSFTYDSRGRRTSVTDQNGKTTTYDDAGLLVTVTDPASNVTTYGHDTEDNLTSITDANNNTTNFTYDTYDRRRAASRGTFVLFPHGVLEPRPTGMRRLFY